MASNIKYEDDTSSETDTESEDSSSVIDYKDPNIEDVINIMKKRYKKVKQNKSSISPGVYKQPKKGEYVTKCPPKRSHFMTTEEFDTIVKKKQNREVFKQKLKLKREKKITSVINKIETEFKESAMRDLVNKFANYMADKCVKTKLPSVMTGNLQRMTYGLVANMYLSLGMNAHDDHIRSSADYGIFETMAYVLVHMIVEAQYQVDVYPQPEDPIAQEWEKYEREYYEQYNNISDCLRKRAQKIAQKKIRKNKV